MKRRVAYGLLAGLMFLTGEVAAGAALLQRPTMLDREAVFTAEGARQGLLLGLANAGRRVVAVGEGGHILLSDDQGATWRSARKVPTSATLTAVRFADAKAGWAVGHLGVVLRTEDGGETWVRQLDGVQAAALTLQAVQAQVGSEPTDAQRMTLKLAELSVADGPNKPFLTLVVTDAQQALALGAFGLALETRDGGRSWASVTGRFDNDRGSHFYGVVSEGGRLWLAGEQGLLLRPDDAGRSRAVTSPYPGTLFGMVRARDGALVAFGLRGTVLRSADAGATWVKVASGSDVAFQAGAVLPDGTLVLVNEIGQLFVSRDHGQRLTALDLHLPPVADLLALSDKRLLAAGPRGVQIVDLSGQKALQ